MPAQEFYVEVTSQATTKLEEDVFGFSVGLALYRNNVPYPHDCKVHITSESADLPMVGTDEYGRITGIKTDENENALIDIEFMDSSRNLPVYKISKIPIKVLFESEAGRHLSFSAYNPS